MARKFLLVCLATIICLLLFVVVDFLQIGRKAPPLTPIDERATRIKVDKAARQLILFRGSDVLKSYRISLGAAAIGHKAQEGDGRTPEGLYSIEFKNDRSHFHLALRISYPNAEDQRLAQQRGLPPGSDIMIHGLPNGLGWLNKLHLKRDWTDGCIAVTNDEIEEIWRLVATGTPVEIRQ